MAAVGGRERAGVDPVGRSAVAPGSAWRQAARDTAPFCLAIVPFGLAVGSASAAAGLSGAQALFGAIALLAGSAQLGAIEVIGSGGGVAVTVMVVALVNLRFVFYGAGVAAWFAEAPLWRRLLLAFPIVDHTFVLCQERFGGVQDVGWRQRYYVTATVLLGGAFVAGQVVSFSLGTSLPEGLGLHVAAPLAFAGMLAKAIKGRPEVIAGSVAAVAVVLGTAVVGAVALPLGVAIGVAAAMRLGGRP